MTMPPRDDRVLPLTKAVAILVIPVLVAAVVILCLQPERASEVFAWPIKPQLTGMLLGSGVLRWSGLLQPGPGHPTLA